MFKIKISIALILLTVFFTNIVFGEETLNDTISKFFYQNGMALNTDSNNKYVLTKDVLAVTDVEMLHQLLIFHAYDRELCFLKAVRNVIKSKKEKENYDKTIKIIENKLTNHANSKIAPLMTSGIALGLKPGNILKFEKLIDNYMPEKAYNKHSYGTAEYSCYMAYQRADYENDSFYKGFLNCVMNNVRVVKRYDDESGLFKCYAVLDPGDIERYF